MIQILLYLGSLYRGFRYRRSHIKRDLAVFEMVWAI